MISKQFYKLHTRYKFTSTISRPFLPFSSPLLHAHFQKLAKHLKSSFLGALWFCVALLSSVQTHRKRLLQSTDEDQKYVFQWFDVFSPSCLPAFHSLSSTLHILLPKNSMFRALMDCAWHITCSIVTSHAFSPESSPLLSLTPTFKGQKTRKFKFKGCHGV
jgi:hypothetical protein